MKPPRLSIPGLCIECRAYTSSMPLCSGCADQLYDNDGDTWERRDSASVALRVKAQAWLSNLERTV